MSGSPVAPRGCGVARALEDTLVFEGFQANGAQLAPREPTLAARDRKTAPTLLKKQGRDTAPAKLVPGVTSLDREITGAAGSIPAWIYTPDVAGPFPVVVYFHGGGWVIADKEVYNGGARGLSKQAQAIVVSVDYRRDPCAGGVPRGTDRQPGQLLNGQQAKPLNQPMIGWFVDKLLAKPDDK